MRYMMLIAAAAILAACDTQCGGAMEQTNNQAGDRRFAEVRHTNLPYDISYISSRYQTLDAWKLRASELREQILAGAGLLPMPEKCPLNAKVFGRIGRDDYTITKVCFESYPGLYVTGNLYVPKGKGPFPAVVVPHGHCDSGRLEDTENRSYPGLCINFARRGYAAFAYDMIGYNDNLQLLGAGEDKSLFHCSGSDRSDRKLSSRRQNLWGISLGGLQLWNSIRAVDFLQSLPYVDKSSIAATGHSGGGTQTFLLCAVDERVKVGAPVVMISAHMQGGCRCENIPNIRIDTNNVEIAALMAPRPMIVVSATGDWTKDTPKTEYPAIQHIYKLFGAEDRVANVHVNAEHNYNQASREAVYSWFAKWLPKAPASQPAAEMPYQAEKPDDLRVFPDGKLPADAVDAIALTSELISAAKAQIESCKPIDAAGLSRLRKMYMPVLRHTLSMTSISGPEAVNGDVTTGPYYTATEIKIVDKARGAEIPGVMYLPAQSKRNGVVLMVYARGLRAFEGRHHEPGNLASELLKRGQRVLMIDCFYTGSHAAPKGTPARNLDTDFFDSYNRTDLAERVYDILVAANYLSSRSDMANVNLLGMGKAGLWCMFARPFAPKVARLAVDASALDMSDDESYIDTLYTPALRRAGDFRSAMALCAPCEMIIMNTKGVFDISWAQAAYTAAGASEALEVMQDYPSDFYLAQWLSDEE